MESFLKDRESRLGWRLDLANWLAAQVLGDALTLWRKDALTGLPDREGLDHELMNADDYMLLFIDLDGLKAINDRQGHSAGDKALQAVAGALLECLRVSDFAARVGGDEFVVVLHSADAAECELVVKRIREQVKGQGYSASIGYGKTLAEADEAMYTAKRQGNQYQGTREAGISAAPRASTI
jgi:GGDEF domain-containing protein